MKSYLSLIPISAKVRKRQNRMTIACIVLAVFLVTAIFSMADMELRNQKTRAISDYGNWHITLKDISESDAKQIQSRNDVVASAWYATLNFRLKEDYYIDSKRMAICGIEKPIATDILSGSIVEGEYPENDNEILLTENAKDSLNVDIGGVVTLKTPKGEETFTVSGFEATTAMVNKTDAVVAFMPMEVYSRFYEMATQTALEDSDKVYYVQFRENANIRKAIADIRRQYNLGDGQIGQNTVLLGVMGMSGDFYMLGLYLVAAVLSVLVLTAGVLMIASSMNSNIAQRTEFFGMMRCIGASKKQIMRFVRLEALNWCKMAIPIGIACGVIVTWALSALLKYLSSRYFADMPVFAVSTGGIAAGVIVGLLTVIIAAQSPAKRAAKVSPMAAVSGNAGEIQNIKHVFHAGALKVDTLLGVNHAVRSKKNFALMVGSFALSIVLFLAFSVLITFMNHAITPLMPYTPDLSIVCEDSSCSIDRGMAGQIAGMDGVKRVYGRSFAYDIPAKFGETDKKITLISYESNQFNWIDEQGWADDKRGLEQVVKDKDKGYVLAVYSPEIPITAGSQITTGLGDLTVASVVAHVPFDRSDGEETLICSEELFAKLTGSDKYTIIDIQMEKSATDAEVNAIRDLSDGYLFSDNRLSNKEVRAAYYSFALFVYGFLAVIAMITVFNIMNSISMSISARIKQYGAMRAIGMSIRQLRKMITAEALTYALCGCIAGCAAGFPIHRLIFVKLITERWGDVWTVPFYAITVVALLTVLTSFAAVHVSAKRIQDMAVTNMINECMGIERCQTFGLKGRCCE